MCTATTSIPYTKVTSIHYQTLSTKYTTGKIDVNNLSVCSLQGLLLLFHDKRNDFAKKMKNFTIQTSKTFQQQLMECLTSYLQLAYKSEIFTQNQKEFFTDNTLM